MTGRNQAAGLTMIEAMMALCLLATISLGAVAVLPSTFSAERRIEQQELATVAAAEALEQVRQQSFSSIASSHTKLVMGTQSYPCSIEVTPLSASLKAVAVTVAYGASHVVLQSYIYGQAGQVGQD